MESKGLSFFFGGSIGPWWFFDLEGPRLDLHGFQEVFSIGPNFGEGGQLLGSVFSWRTLRGGSWLEPWGNPNIFHRESKGGTTRDPNATPFPPTENKVGLISTVGGLIRGTR